MELNKSSIQGRYLTVVGKGDKERTVYLNDSCIQALTDYEHWESFGIGAGEDHCLFRKKEHVLRVKRSRKS